MPDSFDLLVLLVGGVVIALEHALLRYAPNLIRYSAGTAVILGISVALLGHHSQTAWLWVPLVAVAVTGAATTAFFLLDGGRDVVRLWQTEGPLPLPAFLARLAALYRRTHGEDH